MRTGDRLQQEDRLSCSTTSVRASVTHARRLVGRWLHAFLPARGLSSSAQAGIERQVILVRWVGIAVAMVAGPLLLPPGQLFALWIVCACAASYNVLLGRVLQTQRKSWLWHRDLTALGDIALADAVIYYTGGLSSPLYVAYFLIAVAAAIRFGGRAAALATTAVLASYAVLILFDGQPVTRAVVGKVVVRVGFVAATALFTGFVADRVHTAEAELADAYDATLSALSAALDERDTATEGHSRRVAAYAQVLGRAAGLTEAGLESLARGALLHDIGKIAVPDDILRKPGRLAPDEWAVMRRHPEVGAKILKDVSFLTSALPVVRYHHEHWDGSGYPEGRRAEGIDLRARIFAIVDAYDAMTSDRPYRRTLSHEEAVAEVERVSGTQFDPRLVRIFAAIPADTWTLAVKSSVPVDPVALPEREAGTGSDAS